MAAAFESQKGILHCEGCSLKQLARDIGTPLYVYSRNALVDNFRQFDRAFGEFPHLVCFAVKDTSNLSLLRLFRDLGAGFDIVSGGELFRARQVGADPQKVVFSGVGKKNVEIDYALNSNILLFNVESKAELDAIEARGKTLNIKARVAIRVNPDIDPDTHPHIATGLLQHKFGIGVEEALPLYRHAASLSFVEPVGVSCHIGSQVTTLNPFVEATQRVLKLVEELNASGIRLRYIDLGGGLGIRYRDECPPTVFDYAAALTRLLAGRPETLILEPGRILAADAAVLLTEVLYLKQSQGRQFVVADAGMNDLLRPGLYGAFHDIVPVEATERDAVVADVVGPVWETTDYLARDRSLPQVQSGEVLAVKDAGAYGFTLSSNYNSRPRAAEVLVDSQSYHVIRKRESYEDLVRGEKGF
ncbi:MAG: diaminopimelate decarboxylase [Acidimicrobiia bacterium]|nr:diaminopimelate decarboxylase [Acidimicrobiia bacterium]